MPWLDPARQDESLEDRELRAELRGLVGLPMSSFESNFFGAEPTPELVKLADNLRAEALRRRNTSRHRPMWMLLAAGLPVALLISGLGAWGIQQKQKADVLAAAAVVEKAKAERAAQSSQVGMSRDREGHATDPNKTPKTPLKPEDSAPAADPSLRLASTKSHKGTGTTTFTPGKPANPTDYPVIEVKQTLLPPPVGERVKAQ